MKNYLLLLTLFLSLISCKKENNETCTNNNLFSKVTLDSVTQQELTYTGNCTIYESVELYKYRKYHYDAQSRLVRMDEVMIYNPTSCLVRPPSGDMIYQDPRKAKITQYCTFDYDTSGRLSKKSFYFINNDVAELNEYLQYEYDNQHLVKIERKNPQSQTTVYFTCEYDLNDNLIKENYYYIENGEAKLGSTDTYEYDTKNNPFIIFACEGEPGVFTNKNNITKNNSVSYMDGVEYNNQTVEFTYEYNSLDYPVKCNGRDYIYGK